MMDRAQRQIPGAALIAMAEAIVSGHEAGHVVSQTLADNPFNSSEQLTQYRAWTRGFYVGRSID